VGGDNIYIGNGEKVVLASLSESYSKLDAISVGTNGPSSYPTLHCLLTTFNLRKEYMILVQEDCSTLSKILRVLAVLLCRHLTRRDIA